MTDCITLPLGLAGLTLLGQAQEEGTLVLDVAYPMPHGTCPRCGRSTTKVHDRRAQDKRDLPLREQPVQVRLWRRRFRCLWCRRPTGRAFTFSEPNLVCGLGPGGRARRTTPRLRAHLAQAVPQQTVKQLSQVYQVSQRFVETCFAAHCHAASDTGQVLPRVLGIDEFALRRGQRYDTLVCELVQRQVLEVLVGRAGAGLQHYLEQLPQPEQVVAVVIDMSEAYRQVVHLCLPRAQIVVDRFHVVRRVGQALDQVRQRVHPQVGPLLAELLGRTHTRLLQDPTRWTAYQQAEIETVLVAVPELQQAWEHYRAFQEWYALVDPTQAEVQLAAWEATLRTGGLREFLALFARGSLLGSWRDELLNYMKHRYTNAYVEGKHTRTKQLMRQGYGYRNRENLRLRVLTPVA